MSVTCVSKPDLRPSHVSRSDFQPFSSAMPRGVPIKPRPPRIPIRQSAPLPAHVRRGVEAAEEFFRSELDSSPLRDGSSVGSLAGILLVPMQEGPAILVCENAAATAALQKYTIAAKNFQGCCSPIFDLGIQLPRRYRRPASTQAGTRRYALAFAPSEALACSTSCVKPAASFTAISDSILRSISTPAAFSPCISWL